MELVLIKHIHDIFKGLIEIHGFNIKTEVNEGQSYMIEYSSAVFVIKIEKYFREFYVTLYKNNMPDGEINLFNLLEYLKQGERRVPKSEYYRNEKDIIECYKKQLNHISSIVYQNYNLINEFYSSIDYDIKMNNIIDYFKNKHNVLYIKTK